MTADELRALAFRFRESRAVFAGVELGVFEALAVGSSRASELASELALDTRGLAILLDALVALGVLVRDGERYAVASELRDTLAPGGASYAGNLFLHDLWHWTSWARLDQTVREGSARRRRDGDAHLGDPEILGRFLPNYVLAMEQSEGGASEALARTVAALDPKRVLDLGGGSGGLLLRVLEAAPSAYGTLVDHEFSLSRARELAARSPARERMALLGLDFEKSQIPREHDVILLSRVLMGMPPERARALLDASRRSPASGGRAGRARVRRGDARGRAALARHAASHRRSCAPARAARGLARRQRAHPGFRAARAAVHAGVDRSEGHVRTG